jgi:oligopeptide transport system substrate-binding protein
MTRFAIETTSFPAKTSRPMTSPHQEPTRPGWLQELTLLGLACLTVSGIASSCREETRVDRATREKILLLGNGAEPKALDPHIVSSVGDSNILRALFEGLVINHVSDDSIHEPGVAERWEPNADFSEWRFFLRKDAKWSNGDPVTAHDFVYSYHRALHPLTASPYASMLFFLKNGEAFNTGTIKDFAEVGVKAVGDHELICRLESPAPYFPDVVKHTTWLPVHRGTIEKFGKMTDSYTDWQKPGNHVSNGAFQLSEWRINAHVKVRRNPHYWDAANVKPNGIDFYPIESPFTEEKAFRNGLIHYSYTFPENLVAQYQAMPDSPLRSETYNGSYFYRCNVTRAPTNNVDFRRALASAIDQETIVKYVTRGGQVPAYGFTPPAEGGYHPPRVIGFDPEKAREFLKKAGYASGKDVPEFTVFFNTLESHRNIAVAIQDMWKKHLGIEKVKIENQEWKVFQQTTQDLRYDVSRAGWIGDYVDPYTFLSIWRTGDSNNYTGWSSPEYDRLLDESALLSDPAARLAKLGEAETILLNEVPILPIYWYTRVYLLHPDVKNWHPTLLDHHPYKHIDLEPSASADQSSRERERVDRFAHAHRDREGESR